MKKYNVEPTISLDSLKQFVLERVIPEELNNPHSTEYNAPLCNELFNMGIWTSAIPKKLNGQGLGVSDLAWIVREISYGSASLGASFIGNLLGLSTVTLYGNEDISRSLASECLQKFRIWSFAMTEGSVGSDLVKTQTTAMKNSKNFNLSGEKNFITNASFSHHLGVFAQTFDQNKKLLGISCFYVPGSSNGLTRGDIMDKIGWRRANTGSLLFQNVVLPHDYLLGEPGRGLKILTHCLNRSKTLLAAMGVGLATRALDLIKERLQSTTRYSKPLLEQPSIRHLIARLQTKVDAAWLLTLRAANTWDHGEPAVKESSMAKLYAGVTATEVVSQAIELFGARGVFNNFEVSRLLGDAKIIEIVEGPGLVQELLIAREILSSKEHKKNEGADLFRLNKTDLTLAEKNLKVA